VSLSAAACALVSGVGDYSVDEGAASQGDAAPNPNANLPKGVSVPSEITIADTRCNQSGSGRLTITNDTDNPVIFEAILPEGSPFTFGGDALKKNDTVPPRSKFDVDVTAKSTTAGALEDTIFLFVGAERIAGAVTVRSTSKGASLLVSPTNLSFGEVRANTVAPAQPIELENTGNEPMTVFGAKVTKPLDFTFASGVVVVGPGEKKSVDVFFTIGPAGQQVMGEATLETTPNVCNTVPNIALSGWRVNQQVTVNPGTLSFGDLDCKINSTATKTFVVSNYSAAQAATANVTLPANSLYTVTPASDTIPMAAGATPGTKTFTIGLKSPLPAVPEAHSETLTIALLGPETTSKDVVVSLNVVGAVIDVTPPVLNNIGPGSTPFDVKNTGNKTIILRHQSSASSFEVTSETTVAAGQTVRPTVRYRGGGGGGGSNTTRITTTRTTRTTTAALCNVPAIVDVRR